MASYTTNYQLHQWEPTDDFLRTDFNADFAKIDAAIKGVETDIKQKLAEKIEMIIGSYSGNGAQQSIALGFRPKVVIIPTGQVYSAIAVDSQGLQMLNITDNGFQVEYFEGHAFTVNAEGYSYNYLAFR